jgi:hypothetical protein
VRLRLGIWALVTVAVVLTTRTVVYALAPQSVLLAALARNQVGPDVTVPLLAALLASAATAAAVLWLALLAVRERLALEGRRLVTPPRLRPGALAARYAALLVASSLAFALLESTIHWRDGLGWHGLDCLVGPVHRDAIPILAALSLLAVALHGAIEHLLAWARRLYAQLGARLPPLPAPVCRPPLALPPRPRLLRAANGARGPPPSLLSSPFPF